MPAHIGRDAVVRYDPRAADWPEGPVLLMAACLAAITLAAERGDRLRVTPGSIEGVFDEVSQALGRILLPPEAREAQRRGRRAMDAGDLVVAEASFDEACRLGLHDDETRLWRGLGAARPRAASTRRPPISTPCSASIRWRGRPASGGRSPPIYAPCCARRKAISPARCTTSSWRSRSA